MDFKILYNKLMNRVANLAEETASGDVTNSDIVQALNSILDKGITYTSSGGDGIFIISSVETYLKAAEVGISPECSANAATEEFNKLIEAIGGFPTREYEGFDESVDAILDVFPNDELLLNKGIVEVGNFSVLPLILEGELANDVDYISTCLDKGIVLSRIDGIVNIASVETFLKYAEAAGLTDMQQEPA